MHSTNTTRGGWSGRMRAYSEDKMNRGIYGTDAYICNMLCKGRKGGRCLDGVPYR